MVLSKLMNPSNNFDRALSGYGIWQGCQEALMGPNAK